MGHTSVIRARGVSKVFGDVIALDGLDLDVPAGQIHGLLGPNGAGKTTLLGLVLGLAEPSTGAVEVLGTRVSRSTPMPDSIAGFVDGPGPYPTLTARGNLTAVARLRGISQAAIDGVLGEVGLTDVADDKVRGFSLGMRQRLGLAAALLTKPRVLVLDEPANGLDPAGARHVHGVLSRLAAEGTSVLISSHRVDDLAVLCSEVTILARGRLVFTGPVAKLAAETDVLDYRVRTSDAAKARHVARGVRGVAVLAGADSLGHDDPLHVRADVAALDELVAHLVGSGVAVRELTPIVSALEAAFLAMTDPARDTTERAHR